jgi:hypothetical protein
MKKIKKLFIFLLLIIGTSNKIDAQNWQWAVKGGGTSNESISNLCTDFNGNIYIIGTFGFVYMNTPAASVNFGSIQLQPLGDNQLFVVKYSSFGNVIWSKSIGGNNFIGNSNNYESARSISYDFINQCIYITGNIYGSAAFGNTILSGFGVSFYAKMDLNGNYIWAKQLPFSSEIKISISNDLHGHQLIYGYTSDTIQQSIYVIPPGNFVSKFNSNGDIVWSKWLSTKILEFKALQNENDIYAVFSFNNDSLLIDTALIVSTTSKNIVIACFDTIGNLKWKNIIKSGGYIAAYDLVCDLDKNVYITGDFQTNIDFGSSQFINTNLVDMFMCKIDTIGNVVWAKQGNTSNGMDGLQLAISSNGEIIQYGFLDGTALFDTISLTSSGNGEVYLARYNSFGNCLSVESLGFSNISKLAVDFTNKYYIAGDFNQNITFGTSSLMSSGYDDVFLAKLDINTDIRENTKNKNNQLLIHANPTAGKCNITIPDDFIKEKNLVLSIYSSNGQLIQQQNLNMEEGVIKLNLEAEAKGLYNAVLTNGSKSYSGKIVFE